jgi:hypothetical protein
MRSSEMVHTRQIWALLLVSFVLAAACFDDDDSGTEPTAPIAIAPATSTGAPTAEPRTPPPPDGESSDRTTGVPELDAVIEAVESHDSAALRELIEFQTFTCTTALGEGGPPKCRDNEANGTEVAVFEAYGCSVQWNHEDTIDAQLDAATAITASRYAAFFPPDDYLLGSDGVVLLFEGPDPRVSPSGFNQGMAVRVEGGRVTALWLACGAGDGADTMLPDGQADFLLEPPT